MEDIRSSKRRWIGVLSIVSRSEGSRTKARREKARPIALKQTGEGVTSTRACLDPRRDGQLQQGINRLKDNPLDLSGATLACQRCERTAGPCQQAPCLFRCFCSLRRKRVAPRFQHGARLSKRPSFGSLPPTCLQQPSTGAWKTCEDMRRFLSSHAFVQWCRLLCLCLA